MGCGDTKELDDKKQREEKEKIIKYDGANTKIDKTNKNKGEG